MDNLNSSLPINYGQSIRYAPQKTPNVTIGTSTNPGNIVIISTPEVSFDNHYSDTVNKQLKVFIHFAKLFVARYPAWTIVPDSSKPFESVTLENRKSMLRLLDKFPMNEIEIVGLSAQQYAHLRKQEVYATNQPHTVSYPDFQYWALGIDPLPDLLQ